MIEDQWRIEMAHTLITARAPAARGFWRAPGIAGVVFASGLPRPANAHARPDEDFIFLQIVRHALGLHRPGGETPMPR
jgi:hypothetical protein